MLASVGCECRRRARYFRRKLLPLISQLAAALSTRCSGITPISFKPVYLQDRNPRPPIKMSLLELEGRKEGTVLFNDAQNTFYFRLYGVRHNMVKDHSDSERGNPLPPHRLLFPISSKGSFICTIPHRQDSTYHGICYTSRGALAGTRNKLNGSTP